MLPSRVRDLLGRAVSSHNRAAGPVAVLLALCCCLSAAHSQWLEETLYLPDSFGGLLYPWCLAYDSANNTIYVSGHGGGCVVAIDGATNQKIARIPVGVGVAALCYNPTNNKVYCAQYNSDDVIVIDGASDSVIASVVVPSAYALCHNPTNNRVYCAENSHSRVAVIDGTTDSVLVNVAAGRNPCALCCDSTYNKVYCANQGYGNWLDSTVTVIDCVTDSVIATIGVGVRPMDLAWNPVQNRVYVANYNSSSISVLADTGGFVGMEESFRPRASSRKPLPTIVRGILYLPRAENGDSPTERLRPTRRGTVPIFRAALLDVSGREVMELRSGANDVRALAPGVYFVREAQAQAQAQAVRKVVVTR